jgi:hypothetical protein
MIFDEGLVYDVSVTAGSLQDINRLMKLPKSERYFGYSDDNGVIYFIHSGTKKFITKYHKSFNDKGHLTVQKSKRSKALMNDIERFQYIHGVLMGNRFWTFGGYENIIPQFKFDSNLPSIQTTIWSTKRKVWIKGPELITKSNGINTNTLNYKSMDYERSYPSVINSTSIILIGGDTVVCLNIAANKWTDYPDFPLNTHLIEMVTTTVYIDKSGKRYVVPEKLGASIFGNQINIFLFFRSLEVFLQIG